jgi:glycerophosphoryl diester phosphodiesterase
MPAAFAPPRVIAHRGAKAASPENTLASIRQAVAEGASWVEFDVKLTSDGHPILMHDPTLERTTNGKGKVAETTLADIRALDAGGWFGTRFAGEKVPTLEEALEVMSGLAMGFNLEIKPCPGREAETAQAAARCVKQCWPGYLPIPIFSSFKAEALAASRTAAPEIPRGFLFERLPADWQRQVTELGCAAVHPNARHLTREEVAAVKGAGFPVLTWTVNEPARGRELLSWGVDALITDNPAVLLAAIA